MAQERDWFAKLLELAGSGRGTAGVVRRWSAIALACAGLVGLGATFLLIQGRPTRLEAGAIEAGFHPTLRYGSASRSPTFQITGRLLEADAVVFPRQGTTSICAPLVSARVHGAAEARVYFEASETDYVRSRAENRYVGRLYRSLSQSCRGALDAAGRPTSADAYLLTYSARRQAWTDGPFWTLAVACGLGLLTLVTFVVARRMERRAGEREPP